MEITLKAKLENVYKSKDFINKSSGLVESKGKWQLNFIELVQSEEGSQMVMHKVSVPDDKVKQYQDKIGTLVSIPVKTFVNKNQVGFYGI